MDEQKQNPDFNIESESKAPAPVDAVPPISDMMLPRDQLPLVAVKPELPAEPAHVTRLEDDGADESMHGGYASVKGTPVHKRENRLVWIVIAVMTIMCIAVGICSSVITARLVQKGMKPWYVKSDGEVQQHISAIVTLRKDSIVEVQCGTLSGSGIAMKRDGKEVTVLTNAHVITQYVDGVLSVKPQVRFAGYDDFYIGDVKGYDEHYDVAVIIVTVDDELPIYDIDGSYVVSPDVTFKEGDYVVSIGNAMSMGIASYDGIISRKAELFDCDKLFGKGGTKTVPVFRTTAVINAGMSGGGVFDMEGRLVGLGTYRMSSSVDFNPDDPSTHNPAFDVENTGFATPISIVYPVYKRILASSGGQVGLFSVENKKTNSAIGQVDLSQIGVTCEYKNGKLVVVGANSGSGIQVGDIITKIGNIEVYKKVSGVEVVADICEVTGAFLRYHRSGSGDVLKLTVLRGDVSKTATFNGFRYAI
ncbi:MAG: trypsin-like peptidase domain-containing protein [Clostridiales bacterium]|nr:trypsin-like peptidase domain-containing protein [Clostridiales bacterium]